MPSIIPLVGEEETNFVFGGHGGNIIMFIKFEAEVPPSEYLT